MNTNTNGQTRRPSYTPDNTNYLSAFTGEALVRIAAINPTNEEISKITGRPLETFSEEASYVDVVSSKGTVSTNLTFLLEFIPDEKLKESVKEGYTIRDGYYTNYVIPISAEILFNKDRTKVQVIDDRNLSTWIAYEEGKTAKELFLQEIEKEKQVDDESKKIGYLRLFNPNTVRFAHKNETHLMDFIFNNTWLLRHNTQIKNKDAETPEVIELSNFVLSKESSSPEKASQGFLDLVEGNIEYLKEIMFNSDICKDDLGKQLKIGVLLGASLSEDKTKAYQKVFNPRLSCSTFKIYTRSNKKMIGSVVVDTRLNNETIEQLNNEEYPWNSYFVDDLIISPFYLENYKKLNTHIVGGNPPSHNINKPINDSFLEQSEDEANSSDDLPF
jgi:hypothetical protein